jgi:Niemann-Pick C1 protein
MRLENMNANQETPKEQKLSFSQKWAIALQNVRRPVQAGVCQLALLAARNPWTTICVASLLTVTLVVTGIFTNITFESDDDVLFTPSGSSPPEHLKWIDTESDFDPTLRNLNVLLHSKGSNVMNDCIDSVEKSFDIWEALQALKDYPVACESDAFSCPWSSVTQFFNNSRAVWDESDVDSNEACLEVLSAPFFPSGDFAVSTKIFGNPIYDEATSLLISAEATFHILGLPLADNLRGVVEGVEADAVDALFKVEDQWKNDNASPATVLEQFNESSFSIEFGNGFLENIPFLAAAFSLMTVFTAAVFFKRDAVESRMSVGLGATATVTLGMGAAFGLLFICGVPMTSIHGMLPFILVGIGLDDAFIIANEFYRLPRTIPIEERIYKTMEEIGLSVVTTTVTSAVAFGLGCISSIPAVYWLCLYAFPAIIIDFFFSITMFLAIIVIDERRVEANRRDILCCCSAKKEETETMGEDEVEEVHPESNMDRLMGKYADVLVKPVVKVAVLVLFTALFAVCAWSTTLLKQEFTVELVLPEGSYVVDFLDSLLDYTSNGGFEATLIFRDIDQSTLEGQEAMEKYLNGMVALKEISNQPDFFWLRDFQFFLQNNTVIEDLPFEEQIAAFLELPDFHALYNDNIARNDQGQVTASRVLVKYDQVDPDDVKGQIDTLENQESVGRKQTINKGLDDKDWAFFSFDDIYFIWEFYKACPEELTLTTIMGVVAVAFISLLAIPHWTAVFFATPLIIILYVDLLGILQFAGVTINSISYITLTVSIGLMVDFLIHILLRYYESAETTREGKVKDTLKTMGASVAVGGFTTFLGVLPLAFNTTGIFEVVFVTFLALVLLGISHGLILLPVLLSICGPEDTILLTLKGEDTYHDDVEKTQTKLEEADDLDGGGVPK